MRAVRWCVAVQCFVALALAATVARADPPLKHPDVIEGVLAANASDPDVLAEALATVLVNHPIQRVEVETDANTDGERPLPGGAEDPPPRPAPTELSLTGSPVDHRPAVDHELELHWIGDVGFRVGSSIIDGQHGDAVEELLLGGGLHYDRYSLLGEYGVSLVHHAAATAMTDVDNGAQPSSPASSDQTTDGVMHRLGIDGRYAFWRAKSAPEMKDHDAQNSGEMYVQAGGGAEIIQWDLGGRLVRPTASAGVGMSFAFRTSAHRRDGWFATFKVQVAPRIDLQGAQATCVAPCTTATPPVTWSDRSYLFETGFVFGD